MYQKIIILFYKFKVLFDICLRNSHHCCEIIQLKDISLKTESRILSKLPPLQPIISCNSLNVLTSSPAPHKQRVPGINLFAPYPLLACQTPKSLVNFVKFSKRETLQRLALRQQRYYFFFCALALRMINPLHELRGSSV